MRCDPFSQPSNLPECYATHELLSMIGFLTENYKGLCVESRFYIGQNPGSIREEA